MFGLMLSLSAVFGTPSPIFSSTASGELYSGSVCECGRITFYFVILIFNMLSIWCNMTFFWTGGAGVGKTAVTNAIYQMAIRYLNKEAGANPDDLKVLLGAPTGKAAFLIGVNTLHQKSPPARTEIPPKSKLLPMIS
jgi:hypothetical protein